MDDNNGPAGPKSRKQRRTRAACSFCRQRKLRCDGEKPGCSTCKSYERKCEYVTKPAVKRPTNSRIRELEAQNRKLVAQLRSSPESSVDGAEHNLSPNEGDREVTPRPREAGSPDWSSNADGMGDGVNDTQSYLNSAGRSNVPRETVYYGMTSTLFNHETDDIGSAEVNTNTRPRLPDEWIQKGLVAEAAHQRQLETVNYHSGKLDFDGVDPDLGMHLLELHWARQHHSFLITYRPAFMRDMACGGPYFSKLLLNAIYFGASKFSPRMDVRRDPKDVRTAGWRFRKRTKELLVESLDKSDVPTIQALLVMTNSLFALGDERSAAWIYAGIALRMIIDLGMHVDVESSQHLNWLSDEDLEIRRRVFWGAFVVDKIQSLYQGRPASLQDFDARVPRKFLDTYEEFEHWVPFAHSDSAAEYRGSPAYSVSTFSQLCKLSVIMNKILNEFYSENTTKNPPPQIMARQKILHEELEAWENSLPPHLNFDASESNLNAPPPHVFSLLVMYNVVLVLLHRPFVSEGHLHTKSPDIALRSFSICFKAATAIVRLSHLYDRIFSIRRAPYLVAYAIYVAATIHVRVAAQRGPDSSAHSMLKICIHVFDENLETNWAVRRAKAVIVNLMKRMNVDMNTREQRSTYDRSGAKPGRQTRSSGMLSSAPSSDISILPTSGGQTPCSQVDPDLDIDMIIQSFGDQDARFQNALPFQIPISSLGGTTNQFDLSTNEIGQAAFYGSGDSSSGFPIYDPLFGFNGSMQDSLWISGLPPQQGGYSN